MFLNSIFIPDFSFLGNIVFKNLLDFLIYCCIETCQNFFLDVIFLIFFFFMSQPMFLSIHLMTPTWGQSEIIGGKTTPYIPCLLKAESSSLAMSYWSSSLTKALNNLCLSHLQHDFQICHRRGKRVDNCDWEVLRPGRHYSHISLTRAT